MTDPPQVVSNPEGAPDIYYVLPPHPERTRSECLAMKWVARDESLQWRHLVVGA
jgi:hypothetical protein